jgi:hypothetical protein
MNDGTADELKKFRELPEDVEAPVFKFGGLAIGNGFTGECSRAGVTQLTLRGNSSNKHARCHWLCFAAGQLIQQ